MGSDKAVKQFFSKEVGAGTRGLVEGLDSLIISSTTVGTIESKLGRLRVRHKERGSLVKTEERC